MGIQGRLGEHKKSQSDKKLAAAQKHDHMEPSVVFGSNSEIEGADLLAHRW